LGHDNSCSRSEADKKRRKVETPDEDYRSKPYVLGPLPPSLEGFAAFFGGIRTQKGIRSLGAGNRTWATRTGSKA